MTTLDAPDGERIELPGGWFFKRRDGGPWFGLRMPNGNHPPIPWTEDEARAFAAAMSQARAAQNWYKLVPVEPTEAMYEAGYDATRKADGTPQFFENGFILAHSGDIYRAMLAAAPEPPVPPSPAREAMDLAEVERLRRAAIAAFYVFDTMISRDHHDSRSVELERAEQYVLAAINKLACFAGYNSPIKNIAEVANAIQAALLQQIPNGHFPFGTIRMEINCEDLAHSAIAALHQLGTPAEERVEFTALQSWEIFVSIWEMRTHIASRGDDVGRYFGWVRDPDECRHDCGSDWTAGKRESFGRCMYCGLRLKAPLHHGWGVGFQYAADAALRAPSPPADEPDTDKGKVKEAIWNATLPFQNELIRDGGVTFMGLRNAVYEAIVPFVTAKPPADEDAKPLDPVAVRDGALEEAAKVAEEYATEFGRDTVRARTSMLVALEIRALKSPADLPTGDADPIP